MRLENGIDPDSVTSSDPGHPKWSTIKYIGGYYHGLVGLYIPPDRRNDSNNAKGTFGTTEDEWDMGYWDAQGDLENGKYN